MKEWIEKRKEAMEGRRARRPSVSGSLELHIIWTDMPGTWKNRLCSGNRKDFIRFFLKCRWRCIPTNGSVGGLFIKEVAGFHYGSGTWLNWEGVHAYAAQNHLDDIALQALLEQADAMERLRYKGGEPSVFTPEENRSIRAYAATSTWFGGHMVLDYERILSIGLDGYSEAIEEAERSQPEKASFYTGLRTMLNAIQVYIERYRFFGGQCAGQTGIRQEQMPGSGRYIRTYRP